MPPAGVAGCHHLLPPYLSLFSVPLPIASPLQAGDSIAVRITLTRAVWKFLSRALYTSPRRAGHSAPSTSTEVRLNAPLLCGSARVPPRLARGGRTLRAGGTGSGRQSRSWRPAAPRAPLPSPIPPGTCSALTGSASRPLPARSGGPQTHTPAPLWERGKRETCVKGKP